MNIRPVRSRLGPPSVVRATRASALLILCLLCPAADAFAQNYTIYTGQTGAQTQLDINHYSAWYISVKSGTVSLGGGNFQMKKGSASSAVVTLTVYRGGPGGTVLASVSQPASAFTGNFGTVLFTLSSPVSLNVGTYYAALTSSANDVQSEAFFIKQPDSAILSLDGTTSIPPTTATISAAAPGASLTLA